MQRKVRIKDIAVMAGVSAGTVDRILHNRGNVSESALKAVEKVLKEVDYKPNIHISGLSLKRQYKIVIITPLVHEGGYWESIVNGIRKTLKAYENIKVNPIFHLYNQYDIYSCRSTFDAVLKENVDAAIIGPTFKQETQLFTKKLAEKGIPYVFVDSEIDDTAPIAFFSSNHYVCGYVMGKLISHIIPPDEGIGILQALRVGGESANTTVLRKKGFGDYYRENNMKNPIVQIPFSVLEPEKNDALMHDFFHKNRLGGVVVLNSRGSVIANFLAKNNIESVKMVCVDPTLPNIDALKNGFIDFLIGQRPEYQGFFAMRTLLEYLIFRNPVQKENYLPLDILTKETIDYYTRFNDNFYL
ncbi:MAG: substrate-binding domain-containing protein [Dysgonamonadaceae bacterium]|jgi:LacI family transcriptional regulator|nr:substrate-binding domain-containing protein [Dysgonamonadaceae bacterium]